MDAVMRNIRIEGRIFFTLIYNKIYVVYNKITQSIISILVLNPSLLFFKLKNKRLLPNIE